MKEKENVQEVKQEVKPENKNVKKKCDNSIKTKFARAINNFKSDNISDFEQEMIKNHLILRIDEFTSIKDIVHYIVVLIHYNRMRKHIINDYVELADKNNKIIGDQNDLIKNLNNEFQILNADFNYNYKWLIAIKIYAIIVSVLLIISLIL